MDFFRDKKKNPFLSHIIHYTKQIKKGEQSRLRKLPKNIYIVTVRCAGLHHTHTGGTTAHRHRRYFLLDVRECTLGSEQHSGY